MGRHLEYEEFLKRARRLHGDKYIYTKEGFEHRKVNGKIIYKCPLHGDVEQRTYSHLSGSGCNLCGNKKISEKSQKSFEDFVKRAREVHGDKYIYDQSSYINSSSKVSIYCKKHNFWFQQYPCNHFKGCGCPKCGGNYVIDTKEYVDLLKKKYPDTNILFDKVRYVNNHTKITLICPIHGDFKLMPSTLEQNLECPECQKKRMHTYFSKTTEKFITEAKKIHGDRYDYSKVIYNTCKDTVIITCPTHGDFKQTPSRHLKGCGCPKCSAKEAWNKRERVTTDEFIERAKKIHGDKYDYGKTQYITAKQYVTIVCPKHGEFKQLPYAHAKGQGCPICKSELTDSIGENQLREYINSIYNDEIKFNVRNVISPLEVDIFLPKMNIAFEYDGLYWHSEMKQDFSYHINKTNRCKSKNIKLFHIFDDEWENKKDIVKSRISSILGFYKRKIYARNCIIKEITSSQLKLFLDKNHLQGNVNSKYRYGLFYNDEIVAVMSFGSLRKSLGSSPKEGEFEMLRYCSELNTLIVGGASKLLKHFIRKQHPKKIISYADKRWSDGNMYFKLGFKHMRDSKPNYYYIVNNKRENRFKYRKSELVKQGFDKNKSEHEIMLERKIYRIYDCGTMVFEKEC